MHLCGLSTTPPMALLMQQPMPKPQFPPLCSEEACLPNVEAVFPALGSNDLLEAGPDILCSKLHQWSPEICISTPK